MELEPFEEFLVDAIETAVAEDHDDVAIFREGFEFFDDGIRGWLVERVFAGSGDVGHDAFGVEALIFWELVQAGDLGDEHAIGFGKGGGEVILKNGTAGGIRAGFEEGPEARMAIAFAKAGECLANGCGMVPEVVDDRDAANDTANFLAAADALKRGEGGADRLGRDAVVVGGGGSHGRVADVEIARERHKKGFAEKFE